jgi:hypothetical protein
VTDRNSRDLTIVRAPEKPTRRHLIFTRMGSEEIPIKFPAVRDYDLAYNYHDDPHDPSAGEIVVYGGLSKFHAAKMLFEQRPDLLNTYDGFYFLDSDIQLRFEPDDLFLFCESQNLDLAQASLAWGSESGWRLTQNHPSFVLRYTNFVEVMAPYFSRSFLRKMLPTFELSYSGWGLDFVWGNACRDAAIIDVFQMFHPPGTAKTNAGHNPFEYLLRRGIHPRDELRACLGYLKLPSYELVTYDCVSVKEGMVAA